MTETKTRMNTREGKEEKREDHKGVTRTPVDREEDEGADGTAWLSAKGKDKELYEFKPKQVWLCFQPSIDKQPLEVDAFNLPKPLATGHADPYRVNSDWFSNSNKITVTAPPSLNLPRRPGWGVQKHWPQVDHLQQHLPDTLFYDRK